MFVGCGWVRVDVMLEQMYVTLRVVVSVSDWELLAENSLTQG